MDNLRALLRRGRKIRYAMARWIALGDAFLTIVNASSGDDRAFGARDSVARRIKTICARAGSQAQSQAYRALRCPAAITQMCDCTANGLPTDPKHLRQIGIDREQRAEHMGAAVNPLLDRAGHLQIKRNGGKLFVSRRRQVGAPEQSGAGRSPPKMSRGHSGWTPAAIARNFGFLR
jgi:hypothetical protein